MKNYLKVLSALFLFQVLAYSKEELKFHKQRILIRTKNQVTFSAKFKSDMQIEKMRKVPLVKNMQVVDLAKGSDVLKVINKLKKDSKITWAEPDYKMNYSAILSNDPRVREQWAVRNDRQSVNGQAGGTSGADIKASLFWPFNKGSRGPIIAIIDSGVDYSHPDLQRNMWVNVNEIPGNGMDDDNNGYVDDYYGYNFGENNADPKDDLGHGTHVAGIIGAVGNNNIGIAGVNWNARMMALRVADYDGNMYISAIINALNYAVSNGASVSNNSYGCSSAYGDCLSFAMYDAIEAAKQAGHIFVAASGNDAINNDTYPTYPASYQIDNVISVAASDQNDLPTYFTNIGLNSVHLAAPGIDILSTVPTQATGPASLFTANTCYLCDPSGYKFLKGTSMASPQVAGVVAMVRDAFPNLNYRQVIARVLNSVDVAASLSSLVLSGGRLNGLGATSQIQIATGTDVGGGPLVKTFNEYGAPIRSWNAYPSNFLGGVRVAVGDVNHDGMMDVVTAPGPGGGPHVKIFSGADYTLLNGFFAYPSTFTKGVFVALGDVNHDGYDDIVTAPDVGGGPHIKVFSGIDGRELFSFFAYPSNFTGGVRVAVGDVNHDGYADIITAAGAGGGPHVKAFSGLNGSELKSFFAYTPSFRGGVYVASADVNQDGYADIITGAGAGGGPHVKIFDGKAGGELFGFYAFDGSQTSGVRVGAMDVNQDGVPDILATLGNGPDAIVKSFNGKNGNLIFMNEPNTWSPNLLNAPYPNYKKGVFISGANSVAPSKISIQGTVDFMAGDCVGPYSIKAMDYKGALANFTSPALINLVSFGNGKFYFDQSCQVQTNQLTIDTNQNTAFVFYKDTVVENAAIQITSSGFPSDTKNIQITNPKSRVLKLTGAADAVAGTCLAMNVYSQNSRGEMKAVATNTVVNFESLNAYEFYSDPVCTVRNTNPVILANTDNTRFYARPLTADRRYLIQAKSSGYFHANLFMNVTPAPIHSLVMYSAKGNSNYTIGDEKVFNIYAIDYFGNYTVPSFPLPITLGGKGHGNFGLLAPYTSFNLVSYKTSFVFTDTVIEELNLTVSAAGIIGSNLNVSVRNPPSAVKLVGPQNPSSGQCVYYEATTIDNLGRDSYAIIAPSATVTSSGSAKVYFDSNCLFENASVNIEAKSTTKDFYLKGPVNEAVTLQATMPNMTSGFLNVTFH